MSEITKIEWESGDTPRTDAARMTLHFVGTTPLECVTAAFARLLERELNRANRIREETLVEAIRQGSALGEENEKLRLVAIAMGRELMRVNEIMLAECGNGLVDLRLLDPIRKHLG